MLSPEKRTSPVTRLSKSKPDKLARRNAISVLANAGIENLAIANLLDCSVDTVYYWRERQIKAEDLNDLPRSGRPLTYNLETRTKVVAFYCQTQPLPGCGRWTLRWAQRYLETFHNTIDAAPSKSTIQRILANNRLKPHYTRYFLQITDPDFFPKMEHLLFLFSNPPENLFFFDECPGIQLLKRLAPALQTEEMKVRLEEFEYVRNGTMDVFSFLNNATGNVYTECHGDHTGPTFFEVFKRHVRSLHDTNKLHYVMDNLSTHRSYDFCKVVAELCGCNCPSAKEMNTLAKRVEWLKSDQKRIVIHFTPYHGSWLNAVEIWFRILNRAVLDESFGSPEAFKAAFDSFSVQWNSLLAHPFQWNYDGQGLHEKAVQRFTTMLRESREPFEIRFLTKSLKLMTNLLNDYFSKISNATWYKLAQAAISQRKTLEALIKNEQGPKRKKNAREALEIFMPTLNRCIETSQKIAACPS
jgi:transposase